MGRHAGNVHPPRARHVESAQRPCATSLACKSFRRSRDPRCQSRRELKDWIAVRFKHRTAVCRPFRAPKWAKTASSARVPSARTRATRTQGRRSPRMVKRRNSQYAPHDHTAATRVPMDCTPHPLTEQPGTPMPRAARTQLWSPAQPLGRFFIKQNSIGLGGAQRSGWLDG